MISFQNVTKIYKKAGVVALSNVSLNIYDGEFVFVVGNSGAGKSTFLKLLTREISPTFGQINVEGYNLKTIPDKDIPNLRRKIGMVFQDFRLLPNKTVFENIAFAMEVIGRCSKDVKERVAKVMLEFNLREKARLKPDELSGGEQQRVSIARAVVNCPKLILADEPTGNLDYDHAMVVMKTLFSINKKKGSTVIVVTHDRRFTRLKDSRCITFDGGKIFVDEEINDEPDEMNCCIDKSLENVRNSALESEIVKTTATDV